SLQGAGDCLRHAPNPSHRVHPGAGHRTRGRRSCANYCRSRILELFAALRRSRSKSDVFQERFRIVSSDTPFIDLEGATECGPKRSRGSNQGGRTSTEEPRYTFGNGAAFAVALVDGGIRTHWHA